MKQHGKSLAASHAVAHGRAPDKLLARLAENEKILNEACHLLTIAVKANRRIAPAGEWLLDNFYLIEEQIRTAKRHLPKGYSQALPRLLRGPSAGLPRVYDLALETISHGDARVDLESLSGFMEAYQTVTDLNLGELWAIPIMLRLALIENLRRVAAVIAADRLDRNLADTWADKMTEAAEKDPKNLILVIADMARSNPPMVSSFISELARRLQGQGPALALPLTWIEQRLSESGSTIEQLVRSENQQQASDQVSISNSIASLRFLDATDWRHFVETMSVVERTLREDPEGVYGKMNFATRDRYRHVVEKIARSSSLSEGEVAGKAVRLAHDSWNKKGGRASHVGFYLIGDGRETLERSVAMRESISRSLRTIGRRRSVLLYLGLILGATALVTRTLAIKASTDGLRTWTLAMMTIFAVIVVSQFVVTLLNWALTNLTIPDLLPRMDFSRGIPPELRTLVVVPTMLTTAESVAELVEALEVRFLANRDHNVHFCLLSDCRDAEQENMPEDGPLVDLAQAGIAALNKKYNHEETDTFFLFHRPRRWNPEERMWMGYERKRGKLAELNSFLRGRPGDYFSRIVGKTAVLRSVRYVITLDTDTQLPRDSVWQFVGAMAHPLNRPVYDSAKQRITEGYGILQPRVAVSLPATNHSRYARLWGGEPGIDPYTRAVSDLYQDVFGEGSFVGKGIYDVDIFEQSLDGRFPENRILSHDLIEGCYARSGLLSDVQLYEDYPARYDADVARRHRWIRGDWQIARWILPRVPGPERRALKNPLSVLSRWKIADNLRRSLVPAALVFLLLLSWLRLSPAWAWTMAIVGTIFVPIFFSSLLDLFQKSEDVAPRQHLPEVMRGFSRHFAQGLFAFACLPYEAFFNLDAILRAIWRMLFSRRRLLEWDASSEQKHKSRSGLASGLGGSFRTMWPAPVFAVVGLISLARMRPTALGIALPVLLIWVASPAVAWWISLPLTRDPVDLSLEQTIFLQKLSRKTWSFFEKFVGAEDHWLPPDNYQESMVPTIAHRTSPTNMGLALLANLSAYDFGYLSAAQLLQRTGLAFRIMRSLDRHRGHFYNWYDTLTLKPLSPLYVSTVDSGNLAAHVLTLEPGLSALVDQKILAPRLFHGILDTLRVFQDVVNDGPSQNSELAKLTLREAEDLRKELEVLCISPPATLSAARLCLEQLATKTTRIAESVDSRQEGQANWWGDALTSQCQAALEDLTFLAPWMVAARPPDELSTFQLDKIPTLRELAVWDLESLSGDPQQQGEAMPGQWLNELKRFISEASHRAKERIAEIERLAVECKDFARIEYDFLYDEERHLMTIGYNISEHRRDSSYYDLLASEARLCSFVAIAQGQVPQENWFSLGRQLTSSAAGPALLSWDGSMFEYLMPLLVMPTYQNTLLDESCLAAVARQIEYGKMRNVPWGISESGYNTVDVHMNYQYRAFGTPGLGLRRGLAEDLVIASYASSLALMVAPEQACANLQRLAAAGVEGKYGFYEAIDYTPSRVPRGQSNVIVRSHMAHHQGMSLLALAHVLLDRPMQRRFESVPIFQATTLLLQEKVPKATRLYSAPDELPESRNNADGLETPVRVFHTANTPVPEVQLLSNSKYHVMVSNAGGGYSRWKDVAVTRWREDTTCDQWGTFCYIRDVATGRFWSSAHQPTVKRLEHYEAIFSEAKVEFRCREGELEAHTEIAVSPEDDVELRRVTLTNRSRKRRVIEITSYAEVVLAPPAADVLHPAFSNLFVQTEILEPRHAILCTRRARSLDEQAPWMFHLVVVHGADVGTVSYETDRMRFIGRGRTVANPVAMNGSALLSGSQGSVLDPIVAIRYQISLDPGQSATANLVSGVGETRDRCLQLVDKYQERHLADRVFDLAWTHGQVLLRQLNVTEADAQSFGRLASSILYANSSLRAEASVLSNNRRSQSGLWGYAVSGDLPIVLLQIGDAANIELVRQLVQAHAYWRLKGLAVDLVIWNEDHAGYRQLLQEQIMNLVAAGVQANPAERAGEIFVRVAEQISNEDRLLFQAVARAIISDARGALNAQINTRQAVEADLPRIQMRRASRDEHIQQHEVPPRDLIHFNGLGGFTHDGREYVITIAQDHVTPAPWVNVIANSEFGTVISESGSSYTWSENAHEFRLTPWHNDPVTDASGEAFFLRDEESGSFWSPSPLPARGTGPYVTRHGFGYSVFEHTEEGISSELQVYVAKDAAVKFSVLKVRNESGHTRRLSATGYVEWVLGDTRPKSTLHVMTETDPATGALFARNAYNSEFPGRVAFFDANQTARTVTGDRREFLGRNGVLSNPAGMYKPRLSGKLGAGLDPCSAIRLQFELFDGQEREIVFILGVGSDAVDASNLVQRYRGTEAAHAALESVWHYWAHTLGTVNVDTPDPSINVMVNGWLLYQTLACRLWARSGYYQSGGAFGFRDQLQDVMALVHAEPALIRKQLLLCASRQFREGDVQHWWHPPSGRGVRSHCSDDYLWLPLAVCRYVVSTGDTGVLDEAVAFLEGRPVKLEEDSYYDLPRRSEMTCTLYDHCVQSIMASFTRGEHGLPLIGSGDWNDGMNLVGERGKGESVWLGFFLHEVLTRFAELARGRGDSIFSEHCYSQAAQLRESLEENGWDGEWYRRAYFDDGSPLGSADNPECQIDSIVQSWSVLSGVGGAERSREAMDALDNRLVDRKHGLIKLLAPPFDKSNMDPGYIRGYVPGVRENGGQYTHAAIWAAMAFAAMGDSARAWELFDMINPVNHSRSAEAVATYKVEPYVMAADAYAVAPHTGRGGWTWYTGSAGWMYRLIVESLLGLRLEVDKLHFAPVFPPDWTEFKVHYRFRETVYHITVLQSPDHDGEMNVTMDGVSLGDKTVPLVNDLQEHFVVLTFVSAETLVTPLSAPQRSVSG
ncbi:MAG TPA: glucoamylase family protein [Terriglobales bacterium]|jgi:cyclic beta-1,2-glucan synthetase|nr:glucoamylase family protein [Terriglobales bacterium]